MEDRLLVEEWECLESPKYSTLSARRLVDKFIAHPHLEQLDMQKSVQQHIHYLGASFPKNPLAASSLQVAFEALQSEVEALREENRALRAENERLIERRAE